MLPGPKAAMTVVALAACAIAAGPANATGDRATGDGARDNGARVCGAAIPVPAAELRRLRPFVERLGFIHVRATIGTLHHVRVTGALPDCYLTKGAARAQGWRPGGDLWQAAPGRAIGGDRFGNGERRLPAGRAYVEADLDFAGGRRGARRLVFARGGSALWVTMDHYRSFHRVPEVQK